MDTQVPNVTEGAVSGLDHDELTPRPSSGLRPRTSIPADGGVEALSKQAEQSASSDDSAPQDDPGMQAGDNPDDFTVDQVNAHLAGADDDERDRVLAAERDGQGRVGIVGHDD